MMGWAVSRRSMRAASAASGACAMAALALSARVKDKMARGMAESMKEFLQKLNCKVEWPAEIPLLRRAMRRDGRIGRPLHRQLLRLFKAGRLHAARQLRRHFGGHALLDPAFQCVRRQ